MPALPLPALLLAGALTGCGGSDQGGRPAPGPTVEAVDRGPGNEPLASELGGPADTLVIAYQNDADTMISPVAGSVSTSAILDNINYGLLDSRFDCRLTYGPALAESWQFNEDQTVLTMKLRPGQLWSDGQPVTARDIAFTYELVADPVVASPRIAYIENMVPGKRPLVIDDLTLEWHFTHPYDRITQLAHVSGVTPVPEHALKDADRATLRGNPFGRNPIVNGPYLISQWVPNQKIVLEPNPKFMGPEELKPRIARIIFKILPEYATRLVELENGSVDMMEAIDIADAERLAKSAPHVSLRRRGWRFMDYVAWNTLDPADYKAKKARAVAEGRELDWSEVAPNPLFADVRVRRALSRAIDVDKMIADLLTSKTTGEAYGRRAVSTITPELCDVHNDAIQPIPFDPEAARRELAEAGWTDTDGDGILDKDGRPFRFTLITNSANPRRAKASVIIQANLKAVGIDVKLEKLELNTFYDRLRKKDYDAALAGWSAGLFVDPREIWHSGDRYQFNFTSFSDPEVDQLIEAGMAEPDPDKAAVIWRELQQRIYDAQPYTFLYWRDEIVGIDKRVRDARIDILSAFNSLSTWWVAPQDVKYR